MMKFAVLFALAAAATAGPISRHEPLSPTGRIVGGGMISIDQVPYQVSFRTRGAHICGGSIISENWVLTAARCMGYPVDWLTILSGTILNMSGGTVTAVSKIISHEGYGHNSFKIPCNDITLVQLKVAMTFSSTQAPIRLYNAEQEAVPGALAVVTGWGAIEDKGPSPIVLQTVTIPIVSKSDCNSSYSSLGGLTGNEICAGVTEGGRGICSGDFGGPLAIDGELAGIASWSAGCARPGFPGLYTEIARYRDWITVNSGV